MKLTKSYVDSIKSPQKRYIIRWDDEIPGFGVRVLKSGVKSYVLNYRSIDKKQRRITLGRHGVLTPSEARKIARKKLSEIYAGADPIIERQAINAEAKFEDLAETYIQRHAKHLAYGEEEERIIRKDLLPTWSNVRLSEIQRRQILDVIHGIVDRGAPVMANRTLSLVKRIFNFGIDNGFLKVSPAHGIKPVIKEFSKQRALSQKELPLFWNDIQIYNWISHHTMTALLLVLVTAQRPGEVLGMEWQDISDKWWTIPESKSKNGKKHRVPLSPFALDILSGISKESPYVFPSYKGGKIVKDKHMVTMALSRAVHRNRDQSSIEDWTPHDLRRTAATHLARLGFGSIVEAILNHTPQGITKRIYDLYSYDAEKRSALDTWSAEIVRLIGVNSTEIVSIA